MLLIFKLLNQWVKFIQIVGPTNIDFFLKSPLCLVLGTFNQLILIYWNLQDKR